MTEEQKPKQCEYCGKTRSDLVQTKIYRNGSQVTIWVCPEKTSPMQFTPDCGVFAEMGSEG